MNVITRKRRSGLFIKALMVLLIVLYFNVILPTHTSNSTIPSINFTDHEVIDIHLAPTARILVFPADNEIPLIPRIEIPRSLWFVIFQICESSFEAPIITHSGWSSSTINAP